MNETQFVALYEKAAPRVFSFAARRLPFHTVEDVVSHTFETVWEKRHECPTDLDSQVAWAFTIGRYKMLQQLERNRRRHHDNRFAEDFHVAPRSGGDVADIVSAKEAWLAVYMQLSEADRELLDIMWMPSMSPDEAGQLLGIRPGTFAVRLTRLRSKLQRLLAAEDPREVAHG